MEFDSGSEDTDFASSPGPPLQEIDDEGSSPPLQEIDDEGSSPYNLHELGDEGSSPHFHVGDDEVSSLDDASSSPGLHPLPAFEHSASEDGDSKLMESPLSVFDIDDSNDEGDMQGGSGGSIGAGPAGNNAPPPLVDDFETVKAARLAAGPHRIGVVDASLFPSRSPAQISRDIAATTRADRLPPVLHPGSGTDKYLEEQHLLEKGRNWSLGLKRAGKRWNPDQGAYLTSCIHIVAHAHANMHAHAQARTYFVMYVLHDVFLGLTVLEANLVRMALDSGMSEKQLTSCIDMVLYVSIRWFDMRLSCLTMQSAFSFAVISYLYGCFQGMTAVGASELEIESVIGAHLTGRSLIYRMKKVVMARFPNLFGLFEYTLRFDLIHPAFKSRTLVMRDSIGIIIQFMKEAALAYVQSLFICTCFICSSLHRR